MSAFSDWNGPGCHGGASLPQVTTLEQLLTEIRKCQTAIESANTSLTTLKGGSGTTIPTLATDIATAQTTADAAQTTANAAKAVTGTISEYLKSADAATRYATIATVGTPTAIGSATTVAAILEKIYVGSKHYIDGAVDVWNDIQTLQNQLANKTTADAAGPAVSISGAKGIANAISNVQQLVITLSNYLYAEGVILDRPQFKYYFTFTDWQQNGGYLHPLTAVDLDMDGSTRRNIGYVQTRVVAMLNDSMWNTPNWAGQQMPGRCFLRFKDSQVISAIIDATASYGERAIANGGVVDGTRTWAGSLLVSGSKVAIPTDVRFGLYLGTDAGAQKHVYLGIYEPVISAANVGQYQKYNADGQYLFWSENPAVNPSAVEQTTPTAWPVLVNAVTASSENYNYQYTLACENMIPAGQPKFKAPNGAVTRLASASITGNNSIAISGTLRADKLIAKEVVTDQLSSNNGDNLIGTDDNNNVIVGDADNNRNLLIYSGDRPTVVHTKIDKGAHQIAYLTDMSTSVYWQRAVDVITPTEADLRALKVATDPNTGDIVQWGTAGAVLKDGIYLTDPTATAVSGKLFTDGDVALVEDSGQNVSNLADVRTTVDFSSGSAIVSLNDFIKSLSPQLESGVLKANTTVVMFQDDAASAPAIYGTFTIAGGTVTITKAATPSFNVYKQPAYVRYAGGAWQPIASTDIINVPGTFDGYAHKTTLEWSGPHAIAPVDASGAPTYAVPSHFNESYITWTAEYADTNLGYNLPAWSFTNLGLDGYRTSAAQDNIDNALLGQLSIQPDWAEQQDVINFNFPGLPAQSVANPAFIRNKPWAGIAMLEGGLFKSPSGYADWTVDGGDFTGMSTAVNQVLTDPIAPQNYYKNVIQRLWRGYWNDMPDASAPPVMTIPASKQPAAQLYAYTLRWVNYTNALPVTGDKDELVASNGVDLFRFIPANSYQSGLRVLQTVNVSVPAANQYNVTFTGTDFTAPGNPQAFNVPFTWTSDGVSLSPVAGNTAPGGAFNTLEFANGVNISSPRLTFDEQNIAANAASLQAEIGRAKAAEEALDVRIDDEVARAMAAEEAEEEARIDADNAEAGTRAADDATLQQLINAETSRARGAENALSAAINTEASDRAAAIAAEASDRAAAIAAEATARSDADTAIINISTPAAIAAHDTSGTAHTDIRNDISTVAGSIAGAITAALAPYSTTADMNTAIGTAVGTAVAGIITKLGPFGTVDIPAPPAGPGLFRLQYDGGSYSWQ